MVTHKEILPAIITPDVTDQALILLLYFIVIDLKENVTVICNAHIGYIYIYIYIYIYACIRTTIQSSSLNKAGVYF